MGWQQVLGDVHLLVDGERVDPLVKGFAARFTVPAGAKRAWLVSRSTITAPTAAGEHRSLGLCLAALTIIDGFGGVEPSRSTIRVSASASTPSSVTAR